MKKIVLLMIFSVGLFSCQQNKTAFINNSEVMSGFEKLKQTEDDFAKEEQAIKVRIDSLVAESGYQELVQEYQTNKGKMSQAKEDELYDQIMQIQQQLGQQQQMANQQFQQRKNSELNSLNDTIETFIKEYGKSNGYTYIYGANDSGSIMYADENLNITDEIIKALNEKYKVDVAEPTLDSEESEDGENIEE